MNETYVLVDKDGICRVYSSERRVKGTYKVNEKAIKKFCKTKYITQTILYNNKLRIKATSLRMARTRRVFYAFRKFLLDYFVERYKITIPEFKKAWEKFLIEEYSSYVAEQLPKALYDGIKIAVREHMRVSTDYLRDFIDFISELCNRSY